MTTNAVVLGCGLVGATMARDLAADAVFEVTAADIDTENLHKLGANTGIKTIQADLSDPDHIRGLIADCDIVVGGLPSRIGFQTLRTVIEAGKPYCDITFMSDDAMELDELAKKHDVTAVVDCGVSPGLSNLFIGYVHGVLDRTDRAVIYVGGLPKVRHWPYHYKAPFAPSDVIEEYTRPARLVENGSIVIKSALSEPELLDFPRAGTLEAFNTDGLRSLLKTVDIPDMKEKTLRYPGHCELMRVLRETGFFDKEEIDIRGTKVRPLDVTSKLLFPKWTRELGEEEYTILRVIIEGSKDNRRVRYTYDLYDEYDSVNDVSSMARTTGFPNVIMARMIASRQFDESGVFPPELLARKSGLFEQMIAELAGRGVSIEERVEQIV
ncbi:MAG: saccharopine dehydrogenase NADP-binding domain-containing protein [Phycisphaerales bacterium]|nr:MAG: saccharopine dehydrogenase NADP-binding domain-containing protein [Phycisphaerales bacterium]